MDIQKNKEQRHRIIATFLFTALVSFLIFRNLKSDYPDTRAHTPLEEIIGKKNPKDIFPLLNFSPTEGVDIHDDSLLLSVTAYILKHTSEKINEATAKSRASSLILGSSLFDVPLDMLLGQAHGESHFGTEGKGRKTHNMLNIGNTDSGDTRTFASFQLGTFAACANISGRLYHYCTTFEKRKKIDYTSIWINRDTKTGKGFLPNQLHYNEENPFLGNRNPAGAYMSDIDGPKKIFKKIKHIRGFVKDEDCVIEPTDKMKPGTVYYEKTLQTEQVTYYSFSSLVPRGETRTVGEWRKQVAYMIGVSPSEIAVIPYDHSRENMTEEDKSTPSGESLLYFLYVTSTQQ